MTTSSGASAKIGSPRPVGRITGCPLPQSERIRLFTQLSHDAAALAKRPAHDVALSHGELSVHDCPVHDVFYSVERRRSGGQIVERLGATDTDHASRLELQFG